ncbi:hypothetical protein NDN08_005647 [Rhodosorus marinus]|uniref:Uncharacterized protein n=1 Tax=Rhodosorus marinus TaxID=101924 RepID=A0AAV8V4S2_9RHOD|nr:hypothetical protein NDN08_005647 [Rhodosorus marinus]
MSITSTGDSTGEKRTSTMAAMDYLDELTSILSSGSVREGGVKASNCETPTNDGLDQKTRFELELLEFESMLMDLTCFPDDGLPRKQSSIAPSVLPKPIAQSAENRTATAERSSVRSASRSSDGTGALLRPRGNTGSVPIAGEVAQAKLSATSTEELTRNGEE